LHRKLDPPPKHLHKAQEKLMFKWSDKLNSRQPTPANQLIGNTVSSNWQRLTLIVLTVAGRLTATSVFLSLLESSMLM